MRPQPREGLRYGQVERSPRVGGNKTAYKPLDSHFHTLPRARSFPEPPCWLQGGDALSKGTTRNLGVNQGLVPAAETSKEPDDYWLSILLAPRPTAWIAAPERKSSFSLTQRGRLGFHSKGCHRSTNYTLPRTFPIFKNGGNSPHG